MIKKRRLLREAAFFCACSQGATRFSVMIGG
jgi:hypothetical protein